MRRIILAAELALLLLFLFPLTLLSRPLEGGEAPESSAQPSAEGETASSDAQETVRLLTDGEVVTLSLSDYLWGVVAAEMPASFESGALQAQAVAARTYVRYKMLHPTGAHPDADMCDDITCCNAYLTPEEAAAGWGASAAGYAQKIADAVSSTDGLVVLYEGEPIDAVFHSSSAGATKDAVAVWGSAVPYLVGVESPEGEEVPNYVTTVTVTPEEFRTAFSAAYPEADLSGSPAGWFAPASASTTVVGGVEVANTQLRTLFSLRSASFAIAADDTAVTFTVTGYGHGVGMSQYGANALAKEGKTFEEILTWYYTGTTVGTYVISG